MSTQIPPNLRLNPWELYRRGFLARWKLIISGWHEFRRNPLGVIGLTLILVFTVMVVVHPILLKTIWRVTIYDPYLGFDKTIFTHPSPASQGHILGTDGMGRDVLSQLMFGARMSFRVGIAAAIVAVTLSTVFGSLAAYFGGVVDLLMMGISDVFVLLPALVLMLIIGLLVRLDWFLIAVIFGVLTGLGSQAVVVKSHSLILSNKPFIEAARTAGGGHLHILRKHIWPGLMPLALVHAVMTVVGAVLTESLLSFFSRTHDYMTWGSMIWLGQRTFRWFGDGTQWNVLIPPAIAIMLFCSAFYLVGRALDDIVNPRLRSR
jgi:peptide/nickel transport system permease protein